MDEYYRAVRALPAWLARPLSALPPDTAEQVHEIRLRVGCGVQLTIGGKPCCPAELPALQKLRLTPLQMEEIFVTLCGGSVHSHETEIAAGYVTLSCGCRAGLAGQFYCAPGQSAVFTIMQMDEGLDTGDMIDKVVVPIEKEETGGSLFDKLSIAGAKLCVKVMADLEAGVAGRIPQPEESTTSYAKMISKQMGKIDWNRPAKEIEQLVRGLNPWPSAYTSMNGKNLKIWSAEVLEKSEADEAQTGQILRADKNGLLVQTKEGCLNIKELQLEGKKRMDTASFLRGYPVDTGLTLGDK